jgi:2-polyprenyl-3-methyl-5-hydroxy-6-metoxy-1,4-benzoquinol methylase
MGNKDSTCRPSELIQDTLHSREAAFHDAWANNTKLGDISVRESFEAPTAMENQFILQRMGDLHGKKLLDIGAGLGESSVYLAMQGADVTTVDISPQMVEIALNLGVQSGVKLTGLVSGVETLTVPAAEFDFIYIANTIHHVQDRAALFEQMHCALKPGGKFFSYDPLSYNPAINVYRRMASTVRTLDERPLTAADLTLAKKFFRNVGHREFWVSSQLLFVKYYCIDRVSPKNDRYWKKILRETPRTLWWWIPLRTLDSFLARLPLVRWLAWNMVMWGEKAAE